MTKRFVFLDPDDTIDSDWLGVIVEAPMGVVYANQCGGTATETRQCEGFFVPLSTVAIDAEQPRVTAAELSAPFHGRRGSCHWDLACGMARLPPDKLEQLKVAVERIPFWYSDEKDVDHRAALRLDSSRLEEVAEAWVPVLLPEGSTGILVWKNCD